MTHLDLCAHEVPHLLLTSCFCSNAYRPGLLQPGVTLFGAYQYDEQAQGHLQAVVTEHLQHEAGLKAGAARTWAQGLTFHHQWMVLSRQHAQLLVAHKAEMLKVSALARIMPCVLPLCCENRCASTS